ncbi:MAG: hypothetical protein A2991_00055 [Candidatus Terrybacteria bacterium RIFCSPLOWO2_01_FULL_58_14]|uniref:ATP-dependent helicase PriA n=2 Tax=Candidatus Terryibacteriota TaxID=1817920 RepID=A0A1G2PYJ7_9BACT|nr:MAG: hypothetical protein A2682_01030 [Candidatus Terrybacteria bacterium RIFCSPHIGHO2_01_FULL_58_15]OHA53385.1 MAG: hypothetical protein A2991_00055 [Candidatus Terrybacteria bacterium RIFCSPLOWO2_01_FULL_58_14]
MLTVLEIAPALHIPRPHSGRFSYRVPEGMKPPVLGALVEIPFGNRFVLGLVTNQGDSSRHRPFPLKTIARSITNASAFPETTLRFLEWEATATLTPFGDILRKALPLWANDPRAIAALRLLPQERRDRIRPPRKTKALVIVGNDALRLRRYRMLIRGVLNKKGQALLLAPTRERQKFLLENLGGPRVLAAPHGRTKNARTLWFSLRTGAPRAIIGTRSAFALPFAKLHLIVLDDETNLLHKENREHPFIDGRSAAGSLVAISRAHFAIGNDIVSLNAIVEHHAPLPHRNAHGEIRIIDLHQERPGRSRLSRPLREALRALATKPEGRCLLYVNRLGVAPALTCADCGFVFSCSSCAAPLPMFRAPIAGPLVPGLELREQRPTTVIHELRCRHCGKVSAPPLACPSCRGLRLFPRGVGAEGIERLLQRVLSNSWIGRLDSDATPDPKDQTRILAEFRAHEGPATLIATAMVLGKVLPPLDLVAVPALEQLLATPDFRAEERAFSALMKLRSMLKPKGAFLVQTWRKDSKLLRDAVRGDWGSFARRELRIRKKLGWPPFTRLAKLTFTHRDAKRAETEANRLAERLRTMCQSTNLPICKSAKILGPSPAFITRIREKHVWHLVLAWRPRNIADLRIEKILWNAVPPSWDVDIEPASIL